MDASLDAWIARSAAAMCAASRWLFAASLALSVSGLALGARGGWGAVAALGLIQVYLAARVEFDRMIFEALAVLPAETARFDATLGVSREKVGRSMQRRAAGARRFVIVGGVVFMMQVILVAAIAWLR